jgi:hypothetical protein
MSNDNKDKLKADHGQHSDNQPAKRSLIGFMSIIAVLIMLIFITSCQPVQAQGVNYEQR